VDEAAVRRAHGYHHLRVKEVVVETADTKSFVLDVPADLADTFTYEPGQFCTFRAYLEGQDVLRCYSMSSTPGIDADLTVTVKRVPGGLMSGWFDEHVDAGTELEVTRPAGVFCPRPDERPVVACCGGSGITPVISIAKHVLATTDRPVRMLYANRDADSVIFADLLDGLAEQHGDRLEVRHHLDADGGFLDADDVRAFLGPDLDVDLYICGPTPFMDLVESTALDAGIDRPRIAIERFANSGQVAGALAEVEPAPTVETTGDRDDDGPAEITIILNGKRSTVGYQAGDTILETARRGALNPPFSCEAGNCATCMAHLDEGEATMRANNALDPDEVDDGWVLTCQAVPTRGPLTVEYEAL
jgi:3-ketosteroid 9alpha-monooxygenase subunit B